MRVVLASAITWALVPPGTSQRTQWALSLLAGSAVILHVISPTRVRVTKKWLAEWEIGTNAVMVAAFGLLIGLGSIGSASSGTVLRSGKFAAFMCAVSATAFVLRGGTLIVRGVLDKAGVVPHQPKSGTDTDQENRQELNRGRSIGNVERLLMILIVGIGAYEALGFLIAAKGLVRAEELKDRDFTEYFILGNLTSVVIALFVGITARVAIVHLWALPL